MQLAVIQFELNFWTGSALIGAFILICAACTYIAILFMAGRDRFLGNHNKRTTTIEGQPIEVRKAPKRFNHELAEERHEEITRRLDLHDEEIKAIQIDRAKSMENINKRFTRVLVGIALIGQKVGAKIPGEEGSND